ncbi:MAG: galactokinase [Pirellulales bacterium]|nr:galactokinase [Pirellulales bacterium]
MTLDQDHVAALFAQRFGEAPRWVVRAPGRVNLIGEHTDYNGGFVLPLAIDRAIWIALRPRPDRSVLVHSLDYNEEAAFSLDTLAKGEQPWAEYLKGTAWSLADAGFALSGWEGIVAGDVPLGAGLSSSAALEMATARAFAAVSGLPWDPPAMALLGQRAENRWVGVQCGIMDQLASASGRAGCALLIDCRSLHTTAVPFPRGVAVVVLDTATRRGLADSAYNERRAQCEAAAALFGVEFLRDVTREAFRRRAEELDDATRRRARHVVTENERTLRAAEAMQREDLTSLGQLLNNSHESLRDDFEVSCPALDAMVEAAQAHPSCHGARMTGAGFGGCAVAVIDAAGSDDFTRTVAAQYQLATGHVPSLYVCQATDGASVVVGD